MRIYFLAYLVVFSVFLGNPAYADAYFEQGVRLYSQGHFRQAAPYFEHVARSEPNNSNAFYYAAITYQQIGDRSRAKQIYKQIVQQFPDSQAANLASMALQSLDPDFIKHFKTTPSASINSSTLQTTSSDNDDAQLPQQGKIYFHRVRNSQIVEAQVNGRNIDMVFDTGAEMCVFGKNHLQELGINLPNGKPIGMASGVGSASAVPVWSMNVDLKVGNIVRHNFPIAIQENLLTHPLLGQTFFKNFELTTDPGADSIVFKKKVAVNTTHHNDPYSVPFIRMGNEILVNVQVNGRSCPMIFDTGADTIAFSTGQIKSLGITVPEDSQTETNTGIGGTTVGHKFNVDRMKLGPIDKSNVEVSVVESSQTPRPLLGQNFFKDWQFTIDNDNHLIHFVRR